MIWVFDLDDDTGLYTFTQVPQYLLSGDTGPLPLPTQLSIETVYPPEGASGYCQSWNRLLPPSYVKEEGTQARRESKQPLFEIGAVRGVFVGDEPKLEWIPNFGREREGKERNCTIIGRNGLVNKSSRRRTIFSKGVGLHSINSYHSETQLMECD